MSMDQILDVVRSFDGVLELAPVEGSEFPEVAWGDHFFYYAPDGRVPQRGQPYATIVTKNYPGDALCELDEPGRWRLNIHVGRAVFEELLGAEARDASWSQDWTVTDTLMPHPLYRKQGWVSIINPGDRSLRLLERLLRGAHGRAMGG